MVNKGSPLHIINSIVSMYCSVLLFDSYNLALNLSQ